MLPLFLSLVARRLSGSFQFPVHGDTLASLVFIEASGLHRFIPPFEPTPRRRDQRRVLFGDVAHPERLAALGEALRARRRLIVIPIAMPANIVVVQTGGVERLPPVAKPLVPNGRGGQRRIEYRRNMPPA